MKPTIPGLPFTLSRLSSLDPGERMIYYKGDFAADIARTCPDNAPTYRALLTSIKHWAERAEEEGRIRLSKELRERISGQAFRFFEYIAVGA